MTLKLKTNRNNVLGWWLLLLIPSSICIIIMLICTYCLNDEDLKTDTGFIITCSVAWLLGLLVLLLFKYCDRRLHVFSADNIQVFEKKQLIDYINVKDIVEIKYIRCNIQYIWKKIEGTPRGGDACKMYVTMKQGNCYIIGCFSTRDAKKNKETVLRFGSNNLRTMGRLKSVNKYPSNSCVKNNCVLKYTSDFGRSSDLG